MLIDKEDVHKLKHGEMIKATSNNFLGKLIIIDFVKNDYIYGKWFNHSSNEYESIVMWIEDYQYFYKIEAGLSIHTADTDLDKFGLLISPMDYFCCNKTNYPLIKITISNLKNIENFINIISKKRVNLTFNYSNCETYYKNVYCIEKKYKDSYYVENDVILPRFECDLTFRVPWEEEKIKDDFESKMRDLLV